MSRIAKKTAHHHCRMFLLCFDEHDDKLVDETVSVINV